VKKTIIPFSPPYIDDDIIDNVIDTLRSGWITTGPKVKLLEKAISEYTGIQDVLCVNSWTSGALLILKWLGIKEGDEVIVPAYTYSATALVVLNFGAKPVMVDVNNEFVISPEGIKKAITSKTKAVIPVDFGGWPCDYRSISDIITSPEVITKFRPESDIQSKLGRIMIIGDSAHSFGALQYGKPAVTISDISIFSFHAVKNITTAEGGAICLNLPKPFVNANIAKYLRMMSLNGQTKDALSKSAAGGWKYDIILPGMKINMPDICAAVGLAQLKKYNVLLAMRHKIFELYSKLLNRYEFFELPPHKNDNQASSCHLYALRVKNITESQRDKIIDKITKSGIAVNVHFIPMPMLKLFKDMGYNIKDFPITYDNYSREISLPIYPQLSNYQIRIIVKQVVRAVAEVL